MADMERMHRLLAIAEHDEIFQIWKKSSVELEEKCVKIARGCLKNFETSFLVILSAKRWHINAH